MTDEEKRNVRATCVLFAVVVVLIICFFSITKINAGHTGVVTTFGKVSSTVLDEGLHFKAPWQKVTKVDNRIVKLSVETEASTKDLQTVETELAVNYRIDSTKSYSIIKNVGKEYESILVQPSANEVLKAVTAKYSAEECITNRSEISQELIADINEKLNDQGIYVEDINIVNFNFSDELNTAIEEKQVAEQNKLKAEIEKETKILNAEAKAESTLIQAKAEAQANDLLSKSLTENVINYNAIEKWNGELPKVTGSSANIIDFTKLTEDED
jgi:regulator of protease activity HflC (stomatin/prohibitin superfamily)